MAEAVIKTEPVDVDDYAWSEESSKSVMEPTQLYPVDMSSKVLSIKTEPKEDGFAENLTNKDIFKIGTQIGCVKVDIESIKTEPGEGERWSPDVASQETNLEPPNLVGDVLPIEFDLGGGPSASYKPSGKSRLGVPKLKNNKIVSVKTDIIDIKKATRATDVASNLSDDAIRPVKEECEMIVKVFDENGSLKTQYKKYCDKIEQKNEITIEQSIMSGMLDFMRLENGEKGFKCSVCNKYCEKRSNLISHMRKHTGEKPFVCTLCDKRFAHSGHLKSHMNVHNGVKPYGCTVCVKRFAQADHLKTHMRIHTGEKPFGCNTCDKRFNTSSSLSRHMRGHTGEKPYECTLCAKRFTQYVAIINHMRVHTGEKPYKCSVCNKNFRVSSTLASHMRTHRERQRKNKRKTKERIPIHVTIEEIDPLAEITSPVEVTPVADASRGSIRTESFECDACSQVFVDRNYLIAHFALCDVKFEQRSLFNST